MALGRRLRTVWVMKTLTLIPRRYRRLAYGLYAVGSVAVTYVAAKGWVGVEEVAAWTGLGAVLGLTAHANSGPTES